MTTTLLKQEKPNDIADILHDPMTYEEQILQLKSQPFHKRLAEHEKISSMFDIIGGALDIVAIDLEDQIVLGAFLSRVKESEFYKPASFEKFCLRIMDMQLKDAQDYIKTSEFILASNVPIDDLYTLNWAYYKILALHIPPFELKEWLDYAINIKPKELESYFKKYKSSDLEKFIDWYMPDST